MNYETIKQLAKEQGQSVEDLIALARKNDPFYTGTPGELKGAYWFSEIWEKFNYGQGVHLRRIHYQAVSQNPPLELPNGDKYENTDKCWGYLNNASKWARYLGLVPAGKFVDRRNPEAIINRRFASPDSLFYIDPEPRFTVTDREEELLEVNLPELPALPALPRVLPNLPNFYVEPYNQGAEQPCLIEVWVEKTTMNDVLLPICKKYDVNLITGAGELSITSVIEFLERAREADRPARILYISDYDPAGVGMPISISRKIEYYQRNLEEYAGLDITLETVALTPEQVQRYDLPRVPVKHSDKRRKNWVDHHGKGQVELDALEALHPGVLAEITEDAILKYYDVNLEYNAYQQRRGLEVYLDGVMQFAFTPYHGEIDQLRSDYEALRQNWQTTRDAFTALVAQFQEQIDAHREGLDDIKVRALSLYSKLTEALERAGEEQVDLEEFEIPEAELPATDYNAMLYNARRDYFSQLRRYRAQRNGG
jgi:hypothetical protein